MKRKHCTSHEVYNWEGSGAEIRQGDGDVVTYHICNTKVRSYDNEQDNRTAPPSSLTVMPISAFRGVKLRGNPWGCSKMHRPHKGNEIK